MIAQNILSLRKIHYKTGYSLYSDDTFSVSNLVSLTRLTKVIKNYLCKKRSKATEEQDIDLGNTCCMPSDR